jgi:hypothetical protein
MRRQSIFAIASFILVGCSAPPEGENLLADDVRRPQSGEPAHAPEQNANEDPLPSNDFPPPDGDGGADASHDGGDAGVDAAPKPPPPPPSLCKGGGGGPGIYAFHNGEKWAYSGNGVAPPGFQKAGVVFRLAPAASDSKPKKTLYVLYSAQTDDYLLTTNPNEGASLGYQLKETIGPIYASSQVGSLPLYRFVKPAPQLHHFASTSKSGVPSGFQTDVTIGEVCPP